MEDLSETFEMFEQYHCLNDSMHKNVRSIEDIKLSESLWDERKKNFDDNYDFEYRIINEIEKPYK